MSFILVAVILFWRIPKTGRKRFIELGIFLILSLIVELTGWTGNLIFHLNMNLAFNIVDLIGVPVVILLYRNHIDWRHRNLASYILIIAFEAFALANLFFIQGPHGINSYTQSLSSFFFILISMTYCFGRDMELPKESRVRQPMHWINTAILFYNATTLFIHLWIDYLVNVLKSNLIPIWYVHHALGLIYYGMLWYALILIRADYKQQRPELNLG